jgi:hypothetical protein
MSAPSFVVAVDPRRAMRPLLGCHSCKVLQFVRLLLARGEPQFHFTLSAPILQLKTHGRSRLQSR